jgi:hypothetical protein
MFLSAGVLVILPKLWPETLAQKSAKGAARKGKLILCFMCLLAADFFLHSKISTSPRPTTL